jgi:hypothetical protein
MLAATRADHLRISKGKAVSMRKPILMIGALLLWAGLPQEASAVSQAVKDACRGDYLTHCSQHEVGSEALRDCMADAFDKLSEPCVAAILDSELQRDHAQLDEARGHKRSQRTAERPHRRKHWTEHVRHGEQVAQRFMARVSGKVSKYLNR